MSNIFDIELAQRHPFATSMLTAAINSQRLSHAYLLSGRAPKDKLVREIAPADKWLFARQVAAYLSCANVAANIAGLDRGIGHCGVGQAVQIDAVRIDIQE